jgi:hypothetical protein
VSNNPAILISLISVEKDLSQRKFVLAWKLVLSWPPQAAWRKKRKNFRVDTEMEIGRPFFTAIVKQAGSSRLVCPFGAGLPTYNQGLQPG